MLKWCRLHNNLAILKRRGLLSIEARDSVSMEVNQEEIQRAVITPGSLTLTTDVVMNCAGAYDLMTLKEVTTLVFVGSEPETNLAFVCLVDIAR